MTQQLSEHFSLAELTVSDKARRLGLDNTPPSDILARLKTSAAQLERVRELLGGKPIQVTSGYRAPAVNSAVGGEKASAHLLGWAFDFICPAFGLPLEICARIQRSALTFDQLIEEGTWVHISFDPRRRGQVLSKDARSPTGYSPGLVRLK
jgi:hypothetical protein